MFPLIHSTVESDWSEGLICYRFYGSSDLYDGQSTHSNPNDKGIKTLLFYKYDM